MMASNGGWMDRVCKQLVYDYPAVVGGCIQLRTVKRVYEAITYVPSNTGVKEYSLPYTESPGGGRPRRSNFRSL